MNYYHEFSLHKIVFGSCHEWKEPTAFGFSKSPQVDLDNKFKWMIYFSCWFWLFWVGLKI